MKYTEELIVKVLEDYKNGKNKSQLEKIYGIPRNTIRYWIDNELKTKAVRKKDKPLEEIIEEIKQNKEDYSFILGLYLGDGCISPNRTSYKLRITQDDKYPNLKNIINYRVNNFFTNKSFMQNRKKNCSDIGVNDKNLPLYFPQHGKGKKHDRKIELVDYQKDNLDYKEFLRGLWVTDGSYYLAQKKYECYNFTNKSTDIIALFEECLSQFNIGYRTRMKKNGVWLVEITKKTEVLKMKDLVGIKS